MSVTKVYCDKTAEARITLKSRPVFHGFMILRVKFEDKIWSDHLNRILGLTCVWTLQTCAHAVAIYSSQVRTNIR